MSRQAADAVFQALFSLTDIRVILRNTAPNHELSDEEKQKVAKILASVKKQITILEGELL